MFLLRRPQFSIETTGPVIKGADYAQIIDATRFIDAARDHAEKIEQQARMAFEQRKQEGHEQGLNEARLEMVSQMFEIVERAAGYLEHVEEQVVTIVMNSLRHILATLPPDELIVQSVRKALAAVMANQKQVTLRVPHAQVDAVQRRLNEILSTFPAIASIEIAADSRLEGSDCILETDVGVVQAGVDIQLRAIEGALRKNLHRESQP